MDKEKNIESVLAIVAGLVFFYVISESKEMLLLISALLLSLTAIISDYLTAKIAWLWLKAGKVLGMVTGKVLLTLIFFFILTPIAFIFKLFNKNPLIIKKDSSLNSYFANRAHLHTKNDLENLW